MRKSISKAIILLCVFLLSYTDVSANAASFHSQGVNSPCKRILVDDNTTYINENGHIIELNKIPHFNNRKDADNYLNLVRSSVSNLNKLPILSDSRNNSSLPTRDSDHTNTILCQSIGYALCDLDLYVTYTTHNNSISDCSAYTSLSGFTFLVEQEEHSNTCYVKSNKKDIFASCAGDMILYFLFDGVLEIYREHYTISGTVHVLH